MIILIKNNLIWKTKYKLSTKENSLLDINMNNIHNFKYYGARNLKY